jgi:hypothetical protein
MPVSNHSLLVLLVIPALVALWAIPGAAASGIISVPSIQASGDSDILVPVTAEGFSGTGAILFDVSYGTHTMSFVSAEPKMTGPGQVTEVREINPGVVEIGFLDSGGMTGSGTIVILKFRANDVVHGGGTSLNPAIVEAYDTEGRPVTISSAGGAVTLRETGDTEAPVLPVSPTVAQSPLDPITVLVASLCIGFVYRRTSIIADR